MKTLFSHRRSMLLIRGSMALLIVAIMVTIFTASPMGTFASRAYRTSQRPVLGTSPSVTKFSDFCYASWTSGLQSQGLNCLKHTKSAVQFLKQAMVADGFAKWPQQASLATLAQQGLLSNPQTKASIKTQQDLLTALQSANAQLQSLFNGDSGNKLVAFLWNYVLTSNNAPPPPAQPVNASDQPPSCPGNFQSFQNADLWSATGPMLLTAASQSLQDQGGNHLGVYDIYGRLLLQNHCSMASLGLAMQALNGDTHVAADTVSQWERDTLSTAANSPSLANNPSVKGLFCLLGQPDNSLVDNWFSAAIMTHPIAALTTSTTPSTNGHDPASTTSHVEVSS
jgi:hypothetical protein